MNYHVALITGASTGIGKAIATQLAQHGMRLILLARRAQHLQALQQALSATTPCHVIALDITDADALQQALQQLPAEFANVDVLVNCAGAALGLEPAHKAQWQDWQNMIDLNCKALAHITHMLLPGMVQRNRGHVVNIGSIAGTYPYQGGNVYGATKAFVEQFSLNLRADLLGSAVRVTNIEPGMVSHSEFSLVRFHGDAARADAVYDGIDALLPEDVADSVTWVVLQPPRVNINRIEIMPVAQAPSRPAFHRRGAAE